MPLPKWTGSVDITEGKLSPKYENSEKGPKFTRTFAGPFDTLYAQQPQRLQTMTGTPAGFFVDQVIIERGGGGSGIMGVTLTPAPIQDYTMTGNQVLEVDWIAVNKKLETHSIFNKADATNKGVNAGRYALTSADISDIEGWKQAAPSAQASKFAGLNPNAQQFVSILMTGTDGYDLYAPVVRRTTKNATSQIPTACGFVDTPPVAIPGYIFLKTADRMSRDRTYTRTEEWTGADRIWTILYPGQA